MAGFKIKKAVHVAGHNKVVKAKNGVPKKVYVKAHVANVVRALTPKKK